MKYLSAWVCSLLSGAAAIAIRSLPICRSEAGQAGSAIPTRLRHSPRDKEEAGTDLGRKLGFVLGVGFGVGIAFLLAPKSGANTRSMIARKAREGSDYLKQQINDLSDSTANLIGQTRKEGSMKESAGNDAV